MKSVLVPVSELAAETMQRDAERSGKTLEQVLADLIETEALRRARAHLAAELEGGFVAAESGRVSSVDIDDLSLRIVDRHRKRSRT